MISAPPRRRRAPPLRFGGAPCAADAASAVRLRGLPFGERASSGSVRQHRGLQLAQLRARARVPAHRPCDGGRPGDASSASAPAFRTGTTRASAARAVARAADARARAHPAPRRPGHGDRARGRPRSAVRAPAARDSWSRAISCCANGSYVKSASGCPRRSVQAFTQPRGGALRLPGRQRPRALRQQPLEPLHVQVIGPDVQHVAARARREHFAVQLGRARVQLAPQLRDVHLQALRGRCGRLLPP